ncbi:aminopeptidase [Adhaeribacter arboris]|uniref:Aminopeptidase N n=1 Tax=Adhaeribacter arboris TaxID=2072846 RepID=A0A2T2YBR0_9BACT|nr:M1 family metallopeptidase [Adhaeribacter arboris]PSR52961.1 aminopeptidase [Adhaeribacter arboris]
MTSGKVILFNDPHSFSRPQEASVTHLSWQIKVDFNIKTLSGIATYLIQKQPQAGKIILDIKDLVIQAVYVNQTPVSFSLGAEKEYLGQPLEILLLPDSQEISIHYQTTSASAALQWLEPEQTAGGQQPFLFTQSQAILARTWLPCQDSPAVRFTYEAQVEVPPGFFALMSAENPSEIAADGQYTFKMVHPIPSYLMALAVGQINFQAIGPRTGVYAETALLSAAAYEFAEMEKMLQAAEDLYGTYPWGRYDVLVLPPSFPFGGMENPCLTFATPTIITGDRSLTSLVAHELAHSWSGNLVTNATWNDFWLNEGFTVYFERRIMEYLYGSEYADMLKVLGYQDLMKTMDELGVTNPDTCLKLNLENRDPDEGLTEIAYEKGNLFLLTIEKAVGRARFDAFIQDYFQTYSFRSNTTENFLNYLQAFFAPEKELVEQKVKPKKWLYEPGLPLTAISLSSSRFTLVEDKAQEWQSTKDASVLNHLNWTTHEWLYFLQLIQASLQEADMVHLDKVFYFTHSNNAEIAAAWFEMALKKGYKPIEETLEKFLLGVGRRKFVLPLYKLMADKPSGKNWAKGIYEKARPNYHAVTRQSVDKLLFT